MGVTKYTKDEINTQFVFRDLKGVRVLGVPSTNSFSFPDEIDLIIPRGQEVHFFEELTFSSNVSSAAFQTGLNVEELSAKIFYGDLTNPVNRRPLPLNQYFQGLTIGQSHTPNNEDDLKYRIKIDGTILQTPEIIKDLGNNDFYLDLIFAVCSISKKQFNEK